MDLGIHVQNNNDGYLEAVNEVIVADENDDDVIVVDDDDVMSVVSSDDDEVYGSEGGEDDEWFYSFSDYEEMYEETEEIQYQHTGYIVTKADTTTSQMGVPLVVKTDCYDSDGDFVDPDDPNVPDTTTPHL